MNFLKQFRQTLSQRKGFQFYETSKPLAPHTLENLKESIYFVAQKKFNEHLGVSGIRNTETSLLVKIDLPNPLFLEAIFAVNNKTGEAAFAAEVVCADVKIPVLRHIEKTN